MDIQNILKRDAAYDPHFQSRELCGKLFIRGGFLVENYRPQFLGFCCMLARLACMHLHSSAAGYRQASSGAAALREFGL
ncbi:hypothetical protein V6N12_058506 [Hibiscus sabdariffa]|uniref:Uncharacterized protein n=1 Tax=Hibiscus sabdariffa TaxID=183260 RepID=A0ABR2ESE2_9ROSI